MKESTLKPESLLTAFSKTPLMLYLVAAIAIHVVIIGVTSAPYVYRTWINPAAAEEEVVVEEAVVEETAEATPAERSQQQAETKQAAAKEEEKKEERELSAVEKRVTEVAKPEDIPREPDPLDIPLNATN